MLYGVYEKEVIFALIPFPRIKFRFWAPIFTFDMKKTKIIYWVATILFAGFMIFSAIPNVMLEPDATKFITGLGYPEYFIPFIGVAKLLGSIAILIPGFKTLKEWAYAGLFFDLTGAFYSLIKVNGFDPSMMVMVLIIGIGVVSYIFSHKVPGK